MYLLIRSTLIYTIISYLREIKIYIYRTVIQQKSLILIIHRPWPTMFFQILVTAYIGRLVHQFWQPTVLTSILWITTPAVRNAGAWCVPTTDHQSGMWSSCGTCGSGWLRHGLNNKFQQSSVDDQVVAYRLAYVVIVSCVRTVRRSLPHLL